MNKKVLTIVALVLTAWAVVTGIWGLVAPDAGSQQAIEDGFRWVAGALLALSVAMVCAILVARDRT